MELKSAYLIVILWILQTHAVIFTPFKTAKLDYGDPLKEAIRYFDAFKYEYFTFDCTYSSNNPFNAISNLLETSPVLHFKRVTPWPI
jgi:hypothetical protein